jgi:putative endonuclease
MSLDIGYAAEQLAWKYLLKQGLSLISSNYRCRHGEVDLIMRDRECIVFIEVRARASSCYGGAVGSVTSSKQAKILKTALHYLLINKLNYKYPIRFDVLSLEGKPVQIDWIKNAFGANF